MIEIRCLCSEIFLSIANFETHVEIHKKNFPTGYFECLSNCNRRYDNIKSFKAHLRTHNLNDIEFSTIDNNVDCIDNSSVDFNINVESNKKIDKEINFFDDYYSLASDINLFSEKIDTQLDTINTQIINNEYSWREICLNPSDDLRPYYKIYAKQFAFNISLAESSEKYVANLQRFKIQRNVIQQVIQQTTNFLNNSALEFLKNEVMQCLFDSKVNIEKRSCITSMFDRLKNPFDGFDTDWQRLKKFKETGNLVSPQSVTIGVDTQLRKRDKKKSFLSRK